MKTKTQKLVLISGIVFLLAGCAGNTSVSGNNNRGGVSIKWPFFVDNTEYPARASASISYRSQHETRTDSL